MQNSTKNPPWARSNVNSNMTGMNPQIMDPNAMAMSQQGMMPFQQTYNTNIMQTQGSMGMQMAGQMQMNQMAQGQMYPGNVVAYPTPRAMNPIYQNNQSSQPQPNTNEQRVFTGVVTKTHNDFGFVDHDVFYQTSVCAKGIIPKVNDRVLVEATFNPNMPFKWNATRVQVLPKTGPNNKSAPAKSNNYNAVPPPKKSLPNNNRRDDRPPRREDRKRSRSRSRSRSRDRKDSRRRDSPARKRPVVHQPSPPKYVVRVPRMPLDISKLDVPSLSQRYNNLYVPSDFFSASVRWSETFPPQNPFPLNNPCSYHIMNKEVDNPVLNDAVLEPADADYRFSAKVMLISLPTLETLYQKCGLTKSEEKEKDKDKRSSSKNALHPTRLIKFLVGQKGKGGENFAIGGPWSPSLDGENPQSDPTVLVKTAIRTCKALTGIDLSSCTQWFRMVEFYYWRESSSGGKSRMESVVLFLPDVWSAEAHRTEWATVTERYKAACEAAVQRLEHPDEPAPPAASAATAAAASSDSQIEKTDLNDSAVSVDVTEEDDEERPEPTHYSQLDMKTIKVDQLRQELRARKVSSKGLRPQLLSRLTKLLKSEEEKETNGEETKDEVMVLDEEEKESDTKEEKSKDNEEKESAASVADEKTEEKKDTEKKEKTEKEKEEDKKKLDKEKQLIKYRYELPSTPHFVVHPSATAKGGKFNCTVATLSLLLDYRITDNKEHSFELFVFAELFNEMMMRDFGFYIYKTLYTLPEKVDEKEKSVDKKDDKSEKSDKKDEKKEDKGEKKDDKSEKKDDKRDDKRESRRRDRRDSHSDDERSSSPRQKSRGVDLPPDPYLLLALVYFDTTRCNYITKKDLQNLFVSLGLQLSRSQIRNILEKVCVKENFNYKILSQAIKDLASGSPEVMQDLPLDVAVPSEEVPPHIAELEASIAAGNRNLLPVFKCESGGDQQEGSKTVIEVPEGGMIQYKSRLIDVGASLLALSRASMSRAALEAALGEARAVARTMRAAAAATQAASRTAHTHVAALTDQLACARNRIASLTASTKIFHSALKGIQTKVDAVINIKYEEEDDVVEVVNGSTKNEKKEPKEEIKSEDKKPEDKDTAMETKTESNTEPKEEKTEVTENKDNPEATSDVMDVDKQ